MMKANKLRLGIFFVITMTFFLAVIIWLTGGLSGRKTIPYVCYFDWSVSGLSLGSEVMYNGVLVGSVRSISIAPDGRLVQVLMDVDPSFTVDREITACLTAMKVNGEAIYDTQPWWAHSEQDSVFYTRQGDVVYAIITKWPTASRLRLHHPKPTAATRARMVGTDLDIPVTEQGGDLLLDLSAFRPDTLPCAHAWVIRLTDLDMHHIRFTPAWECFAVEGLVNVSAHADWSGKPFEQDTVVRYTLDGNEPTADSPVCDGTVTLTRSATLRAACFRDTQRVSPVISAPYLVTPFDISPALDTAPPRPDIFLVDLTPVSAVTGYRKVTTNSSADGTPLNINGVTFDKGIGVHSRAELVYALKPGYKQFVARVGIHGKGARGSVQVEAWVGKLRVHRSPILRGGTKPWNIAVDLPPDADGPLRLLVLDGGDGGSYDLTDFGDAGFITAENKK